MRSRIWAYLVAILACVQSVRAEGEKAGDFDYYVLSLSWSPSWCVLEGNARNSEQCDPKRDFGFTLHGLWPQYEDGWPSYCNTSEAPPSRSLTASMADIMGTSGLAWYQWKKHGRCSDLSADDYFHAARTAFDSVRKPEIFRQLERTFTIPATLVEEAFLKDNPTLTEEMLTVTCKNGYFQEVRICLTKELKRRPCGADVRRDCTQTVAFPPIR